MNNDLISREAVKKKIDKFIGYLDEDIIYRIKVAIDKVPTVTLKQGEWIWLGDNPNSDHKWSCNQCGRGVKEQENFCPNCGADMRGDNNDVR